MGSTCSLPYEDFANATTDPLYPLDLSPNDHFTKNLLFSLPTDRVVLSMTRFDDNFEVDEEDPASSIIDFTARAKLVNYLEDSQDSFLEENKHEPELRTKTKSETVGPAPLKTVTSYFSRHFTLKHQISKGDTEFVGIDLWSMEDVQLNHIIQKTEYDFLWEGENTLLKKQCTVRIILTPTSELLHYDYTATREILERLATCGSPDIMHVYCFAIWKTDEHLIVVIVQEPIHCRLVDYFDEKVRKGEIFSELEIFQIMGDVYHRLDTCKEQGFKVIDATFEDVFLSKSDYKIKLSEIDLALPLMCTSKTLSEDKKAQLQRKKTHFLLESQDSDIVSPEEDLHIKIIGTLAFKLMVRRKDTNFSVHELEKNQELQKQYAHLFYLLSLRWDHRSFLETLLNLYRYHKFKNQSHVAEKAHRIDQHREAYETVECLLDKDWCYTYLGNRAAAKEACIEARKLMEEKKGKGIGEYFMLMKCYNRLMNHCIELKEHGLLEKLSNRLVHTVKDDRTFYQIIVSHPTEYYDYIFTQAKAQEARGNKEKAKKLYEKALKRCDDLSIAPKGIVAALNAVIKLYLDKSNDMEALRHYRMLKKYYSDKQGLYLDKAVVYRSMGDILAKQQNHGSAVKHYVKSLDMYIKMEIDKNEEQLEVLDKIVDEYTSLNDDDSTLRYMLKRCALKHTMYGRQSYDYKTSVREACDLFIKIGDFESALKYCLHYKQLTEKLEGITSEKYLQTLLYLSEVYMNLNKYKEALNLLTEYTDIKKQFHELSDIRMLMLIDRIANVLFKQGVYKESLDIQLRHLPIKKKIFSMESKYYVVSLNNIGDTYFMMQEYDRALAYHTECFEAFKGDLNKRFVQDWKKIVLNIAYDHQKLKNHAKAFEFLYQNLKVNATYGTLNIEAITEEYEALGSFKKKDLLSLNFADVMIETKISY